MAEILLSSEVSIKSTTQISDNVAGKYILTSLREAQEAGLKNIIGDALLDKLKSLVKEGVVDNPENGIYRTLLKRCQNYLAYMTIVELIYKVSYKIGNAGLVKTTEENLQVASFEEIVSQKEFYQGKADFYCMEIQNYILDNRSALPEIDNNACHRIHATLHSAATCGLFLGGARGKRRR